MTTPVYTGNTKYGSGALKINNFDGGNNSAFGVAALSISTEKWNTAVGAYSGLATTIGISNTSVGTNTLLQNTSGNYNTALGTASLCLNTGSGNTAVGSNSIEYNLTGENNTIIGTETGKSIVTGSNNICLGYKAGTSGSSAVDYSNCILIGNNVYPTGSNQAIIGDGTQTNMNLVCLENPTMSGYPVPAPSDDTNNIATCEWVQAAIINGGGGGSSLLTSDNTWSGINTFNNTTSMAKPLTFTGPNLADRQVFASQYVLNDSLTNINNGAIYTTSPSFTYDNNISGGSHSFKVNSFNALTIDSSSVTTPNRINAFATSIGESSPPISAPGYNCTYSYMTANINAYINYATGGAISFYTYDSSNIIKNPLLLSSAGIKIVEGSLTFPDSTVQTTAYTGSVSDPTKLPLAGGTMTGPINAQNINFGNTFNAVNYKRNYYANQDNPIPPASFTPLSINGSIHDYILLTYNNDCIVNLTNLVSTNNSFYQDGMRLVTITKSAMSILDYVVTVNPPSGYTFYTPTSVGGSTTIPLGTFSVTYMISYDGVYKKITLISKVT